MCLEKIQYFIFFHFNMPKFYKGYQIYYSRYNNLSLGEVLEIYFFPIPLSQSSLLKKKKKEETDSEKHISIALHGLHFWPHILITIITSTPIRVSIIYIHISSFQDYVIHPAIVTANASCVFKGTAALQNIMLILSQQCHLQLFL